MSDNGGRTRRELLADAAKAAAAASVAGIASCFPDVGGHWPQCTETDAGVTSTGAPQAVTPAVVEVYRPESVGSVAAHFAIQADVVPGMLDAGLAAFASQVKSFNNGAADGGTGSAGAGAPGQDSSVDNPWKILLPNYKSGQTIGLKVNCLGKVATSPALVSALIASLRDNLGLDPTKDIIVWDRYLSDITSHGKYTSDHVAGAKIRGNLTQGLSTGDKEADFVDGGYGNAPCQAPQSLKGNYPRLAKILTDLTVITINCPVFKRHSESGFTGALKNVYGMFDIPGEYHKPALLTSMPEIYALPAIRNSISLTIVDALNAVITGDTQDGVDAGPGRLLIGQDPVALDSYGWDLLGQLRVAMSLPADDPTVPAAWLAHAEKISLGSKTYSLVKA